MATYSHDLATASWQGNYSNAFGPGPNDSVKLLAITKTLGAGEMAAGDVHRFIYCNSNTVVIDAWAVADDLDSDGTPAITFDLGYVDDSANADDDYWLANSTIAQAGGTAKSTAVPYIPLDNFFVQAKIETAPDVAVEGDITVYLVIAPAGAYANN